MRRSWKRLPATVATLLAVGMLACKDEGPTAGTLSVEIGNAQYRRRGRVGATGWGWDLEP